MFYVKIDHPEPDGDTFDPLNDAAELIAADSGNLRWGRIFIPGAGENVKASSDDPLDRGKVEAAVFNEVAQSLDVDYSIAHIGSLTPQHNNGRTVNWVHWIDGHLVGHLVISTADIYILGDNGKTIDRV